MDEHFLWIISLTIYLMIVPGCHAGDMAVAGHRVPGTKHLRVELFTYDKSFSIGLIDWDDEDAMVVCKMLGRPSSRARAIKLEAKSSKITWDKTFFCTGKEADISDCSQEEFAVKDYRGGDAGVLCEGDPTFEKNKYEIPYEKPIEYDRPAPLYKEKQETLPVYVIEKDPNHNAAGKAEVSLAVLLLSVLAFFYL